MRKISAITMIFLFLLVTSPGPALAVSPHFVSASASIDTSGCTVLPQPADCGDAVVSFKEAGLGSNVNVNYTFGSVSATADYGCINGGGRHPSASNKQTVSASVTAQATFSSGQNGNITGSINLEEPPLTAGFSCPTGQTAVLADVTYSDLTLTDTTNGPEVDISTSVSVTFFQFK